MGIIFDKNAAARYAQWAGTPKGRLMDKWLESCLPELIQPVPGERVLDIGCGEGNHLLLLKKFGLDLNGIDASSHMIGRARARLGERSTLRTGKAEDLPFEDNSFDISVMIHTLEFLDNPLPALREAGRVTRRAVFVGTMNSASWSGFFGKLQASFGGKGFHNAKAFNLWELKAYMRRALGDVPLAWSSSQTIPLALDRMCRFLSPARPGRSLPFGFHLGLAATITYRYRTENMALKVRRASRGRSSVPTGATMGGLKQAADNNKVRGRCQAK